VDAGWPYDGSEARVTPVHPRYPSSLFEASGTANAYQSYQTVTAHQTGRNYVWLPPDFVLTGEVVCAECLAPFVGVRLRADGITQEGTTFGDGRYSIPVPYGWSGYLSAAWLWNGAFLRNDIWIPAIVESVYTAFQWRPLATIFGTVYRASFNTNTVPVTITRNLYTNCLDRAEIPGGTYAGFSAAISNATYALYTPHYWYHTEEDRILYINPFNSLNNGSHGVYNPPEARFIQPPLTNATVDFTWIPCDIAISGWVTNSLRGPVANQKILFLSNCLNLAPTNAIQQVVITNIVTTSTNAVTNLTAVVIMDATTNLASSVDIRDGFAFLFNTNRYAFAENLSVTTATNGVYTNWVSVGWSGAIFPVTTNVFVPPAVLVTNLISNLTGVVFGGD
jgi:hypothetical protein